MKSKTQIMWGRRESEVDKLTKRLPTPCMLVCNCPQITSILPSWKYWQLLHQPMTNSHQCLGAINISTIVTGCVMVTNKMLAYIAKLLRIVYICATVYMNNDCQYQSLCFTSFSLCLRTIALCSCHITTGENVVRKFIPILFVLSLCVNCQQHSNLEVLLDWVQLRHWTQCEPSTTVWKLWHILLRMFICLSFISYAINFKVLVLWVGVVFLWVC